MNNQYKIDLIVRGAKHTIYYPAKTVADAIDNAIMSIVDNIAVDHVSLDPRVHGNNDSIRVTGADRHKFMIFIKEKINEYKYDKYKKIEKK